MKQRGLWHLLPSLLVIGLCEYFCEYVFRNTHLFSSFDVVINSAIKAPKYLRETNFRAPSEPTDGFVQYANQTKYNVFQFMETAPSWFHDFNLFMGSTMGAREYWHEWYDVPGLFLGGFDPSRGTALLVDIGGGRGHDLVAFDNTFGRSTAGYDGRLVLQDLPRVLENIPETELSGKISKVGYDFFEEQPEKGQFHPAIFAIARANFTRRERIFPAPYSPRLVG